MMRSLTSFDVFDTLTAHQRLSRENIESQNRVCIWNVTSPKRFEILAISLYRAEDIKYGLLKPLRRKIFDCVNQLRATAVKERWVREEINFSLQVNEDHLMYVCYVYVVPSPWTTISDLILFLRAGELTWRSKLYQNCHCLIRRQIIKSSLLQIDLLLSRIGEDSWEEGVDRPGRLLFTVVLSPFTWVPIVQWS